MALIVIGFVVAAYVVVQGMRPEPGQGALRNVPGVTEGSGKSRPNPKQLPPNAKSETGSGDSNPGPIGADEGKAGSVTNGR
jgi:hypothetical protein